MLGMSLDMKMKLYLGGRVELRIVSFSGLRCSMRTPGLMMVLVDSLAGAIQLVLDGEMKESELPVKILGRPLL